MRSADGDVTTRARIRDAAITLFGQRGFARATVRGIAAAAEVSPGLVIHHFGTKDGLRRACDTHVLETASETATAKSQDPTELRDALDLTDAGEKLIVDYSAGMTKKILLAGALLHRPQILILDEPFEAVDPVSGRVIRSILNAFVRGGGTVVMSSHVMELVEGLCDHVALIAGGRVVASGTIDDVRGGGSLSDAFINLVGGGELDEGSLGWLGSTAAQEGPGAGDAPGDAR